MDQFDRLIQSIETAVAAKNWYAALAVALTVPDVCASLESDDGKANGARYAAWYNKWVDDPLKWLDESLLSGEDCWQLRCAILHTSSDFRPERPDHVLQRFTLVDSGYHRGRTEHFTVNGRKRPNTVSIGIEQFCPEICDGATRWKAQITPAIQQRIATMATIHSGEANFFALAGR